MTEPTWNRVTREKPCPVCGRPDWCLVAGDGTAIICPRTESAERAGEAGYLHRSGDMPTTPRRERCRVVRATPMPPDLTPLAEEWAAALTLPRQFARTLGLTADSLAAFGVGWSGEHGAFTFPMTDPETGRVTGVRLRRPDGGEFAVKGGRDGLFLPRPFAPPAGEPLIVTEGATDAIAAHALGFRAVVGRPSCTGGTRHVVALVRSARPAVVAVVADNDGPGAAGAGTLAGVLSLHTTDVRLIAPPDRAKDVRAWLAAGATRADVERLIRSAPRRRPVVTMTTKGAK